jgi:uncharacterized protein Yka (UPF0111/DUF47 family)
MKTRMIETMGEDALTLPARIAAGLAANDRLKYYFTLLQLARDHAEQPDQPAATLRQERLAAGIEDSALDHMVAATVKEGHCYRLPGCRQLFRAIAADAAIMAAPADKEVQPRLQKLVEALPHPADDLLERRAIDAITHADRNKGDSLHRLVMDLHKQLNALQAGIAEERIDGAAAYQLAPGDEALVRAFMAGLNRTAKLKFSHPGLGTTATRSGHKLIIQNDIGTTDAHVIVIHVEGRKVSLTCSDVHLERLQFFRALLEPFPVTWSDPTSRQLANLAEGEPFYLTTAAFEAHDRKQLLAYLEHLGSRLVFLIDWNRARKQLRGLLKGEQRLALLRWAAQADIGHRGFLELGGARLIWGAVETLAAGSVHLGDRLCDVLGDDSAFAFVQFAFQAATEGLLAHQTESLIRDRISAELLSHLESAQRGLLGSAAEHAGLIFEIATAIRDHLIAAQGDAKQAEKLAKRARRWEHEADQLVAAVAVAARHRPELEPFHRLIDAADSAADELEEVAFLLGLLDASASHQVVESLRSLAGILAESAQEWVKALGHAQHVRRNGGREDADDFLTAIDRLSALEHDCDDAERAATLIALKKAADFRELYALTEIREGFGDASDWFKRASLVLRDHVLADVLAV